MKFCTNCGNQLGNEKFCTRCGTPVPQDNNGGGYVNSNVSGYVSTSGKVGGRRSSKNIIIAGIAVVIIAAIVAGAFALFGGRSYEETVNQFYEAGLITGDAEKIVSLLPDKYVDYIADKKYDGDKDDMIDDLQDDLDDNLEWYEDEGIDVSDISYEITDVVDLNEDDLEDLNEKLEEYDIIAEAAKKVEVKFTIAVDDDEETETEDIYVIKIGRSWYFVDVSIYRTSTDATTVTTST